MNKKYKHIIGHFEKADPKIHTVLMTVNFNEWFSLEFNKRNNFIALCRIIIGQQLAGKAVNAIYSRFVALFKNGVITPEKLRKVEDQTLRDAGMSWAKVKSLKNLTEKILNKEVNLDTLNTLPEEEVIAELIKVKGIGPWTAEMFLMFTLQRENVFSHGDLGLKNGIKKIYKIKEPTKEKINKIIKKWEPYKTFGAIALWHSLDNR